MKQPVKRIPNHSAGGQTVFRRCAARRTLKSASPERGDNRPASAHAFRSASAESAASRTAAAECRAAATRLDSPPEGSDARPRTAALATSGRDDVALYTGNDDCVVADLAGVFDVEGRRMRFAGGLLGHWAVDTRAAVALLDRCRPGGMDARLAADAVAVTDMNAAYFDAAHGFRGCIAGLHEVLRRQGLLEGIWCLDEGEGLSPGQAAEIDRVRRARPDLCDDAFVAAGRDAWLSG